MPLAASSTLTPDVAGLLALAEAGHPVPTVRTVTTGHSAAQTPWPHMTREINMATELTYFWTAVVDRGGQRE